MLQSYVYLLPTANLAIPYCCKKGTALEFQTWLFGLLAASKVVAMSDPTLALKVAEKPLYKLKYKCNLINHDHEKCKRNFWQKSWREDTTLWDLEVDEKTLHKQIRECGLDSSCSRQGPVASFCKRGNEPSGSIKYGEFLYQLSNYWLLK
jgi:hypothetical protein